jgi:hypothetical protein
VFVETQHIHLLSEQAVLVVLVAMEDQQQFQEVIVQSFVKQYMAEVKELIVRLEIIQQVPVVQVGVVRKVPLDVVVLEILLLKLLLKEMMVEPE